MIYVLIIVALFAALSLTLARQTDTSETGSLTAQDTEIYATQIMQSAAAVKQSIDQMLFTGVRISELDFAQTGDEPAFSTGVLYNKVFHPQGGGLLMPRLPDNAYNEISSPPDAGVYLGRFNNVEWTETTAQDVIFSVFQIKKQICEKINERLTGSKTIPPVSNNMERYLIAPSITGLGAIDLDIADCPGCEDKIDLCVSNSAATAFSFYSIIAAQ